MLKQLKNTNPNISSESPCKILDCKVYAVPDLEYADNLFWQWNRHNGVSQQNIRPQKAVWLAL